MQTFPIADGGKPIPWFSFGTVYADGTSPAEFLPVGKLAAEAGVLGFDCTSLVVVVFPPRPPAPDIRLTSPSKLSSPLHTGAQRYHTEKEVGQIVRESGRPREDFYITTKVHSRR